MDRLVKVAAARRHFFAPASCNESHRLQNFLPAIGEHCSVPIFSASDELIGRPDPKIQNPFIECGFVRVGNDIDTLRFDDLTEMHAQKLWRRIQQTY